PIHRRLPKRGFNQRNSVEYSVINLADLQVAIDDGKLDAKAPITVALLVENNIVRKSVYGVKLLGRGELKASVTIEVDAASASAVAGVEKVGGKITIAA
ncbi:MAG: uL15m family ribosomal protein, partial [Pseudomonadota bacterium]